MIKCDDQGIPCLIQDLQHIPNTAVWRVVYFNGYIDYLIGSSYEEAHTTATAEVEEFFANKPLYQRDSYYQQKDRHDTTPASL